MQEAELKLALAESEKVTPLELLAVVPERLVRPRFGLPWEWVLFAKVLFEV